MLFQVVILLLSNAYNAFIFVDLLVDGLAGFGGTKDSTGIVGAMIRENVHGKRYISAGSESLLSIL